MRWWDDAGDCYTYATGTSAGGGFRFSSTGDPFDHRESRRRMRAATILAQCKGLFDVPSIDRASVPLFIRAVRAMAASDPARFRIMNQGDALRWLGETLEGIA